MTAGRQRAFAALYYAARGLESAPAGLYHAAAGLMTHADLHAAITEEWRRFPSSEEPSDASLFDWERPFTSASWSGPTRSSSSAAARGAI